MNAIVFVKSIAKSLAVLLCQALSRFKFGLDLLNRICEASATCSPSFRHRLKAVLEKVRVFRDYRWRSGCLGAPVTIPVQRDYSLSWQVAISMPLHEREIVEVWEALLQRSQRSGRRLVFFDVGANHGLHGYRFLAHGHQTVFFEPQEQCVRFIREVCAVNGYTATIVPEIVGDLEGEVDFYCSDSTFVSSTNPAWVERWEPVVVTKKLTCRSLDSFCERTGLYPDIVKIDVEGGECAVLRGARGCIEKAKPTFVVESWDAQSRNAVWGMLVTKGYECAAIRRPGIGPIAKLSEFLLAPGCDFLLYPAEDENWIKRCLHGFGSKLTTS
jgi:FkbM family methyltransferase